MEPNSEQASGVKAENKRRKALFIVWQKQAGYSQFCNRTYKLKKRVSEVVSIYNNERPHLSLNYMTPKYVHENPDACIRPCWRNYYPKASQRVTVAMS